MGGGLYAVSPVLPYGAAMFLTAFTLVCVLRLEALTRPPIASQPPFMAMIAEVIAYVRENRLLLGAISLDMFAVLLGGSTALLPAFARDILHVGVGGLGMLRAAPALGAIMVGLWFAFRPLRDHIGRVMLLAVSLFGIATVILGFSRSLPMALASLFIVGASDLASVYVRLSIIQLQTPNSMRGRVGAVSSLFISASNELGEAESGFVAALVGPVVAIVGGGVGAITMAIAWSRLFPQLRNARSFNGP